MAITTLPHPSEPVQMETRKNIVTSKSNNGTRVALRKSKPFRYPILSFNTRDQDEKDDVFDFWDDHFPKTSFLWENDDLGIEEQPFLFDSILRTVAVQNDIWNYSVTLKSVNPVIYNSVGNNLPFTPDWGHEVQYEKEYMASDAPGQKRKSEAKSGSRRAFRLSFQDRDLIEEFLVMENFWCYHFPGKVINLNVDLTANNLHLDGDFKIISNLRCTATAVSLSYEFEILEI